MHCTFTLWMEMHTYSMLRIKGKVDIRGYMLCIPFQSVRTIFIHNNNKRVPVIYVRIRRKVG